MTLISKLFKSTGQKLGLVKSEVIPIAKPNNVEEIKNWLAINVANRLKVDASSIDHDTSFSQHGLDSLAAINISAEVEQWLDTEVEPTILYQHANISSLSNYLAKKIDIA